MFGITKKAKSASPTDIKKENTPKHIAFICDGNRRWAESRGMPAMEGHRAGAAIVDLVASHLLSRGVTTISLFIFSTENWKRSDKEVNFLMDFVLKEMPKRKKLAKEKNVRIKFIGRKDVLAPKVLKMCEKMEQDTAENTGGTVCFAFDYGGQDEIVRAAQNAIASGIKPEDLTIDTFETFMDSGDLLPIDLVVRTSNEQRISNFMLWKLAYAELMFVSENWPDLNEKSLDKMLADYSKRTRRFGGGVCKNYTKKN